MEDWQVTTIGAQVQLQRGLDITKAQQIIGHIPVVSSGGVSSYHNIAAVNGPGVVLGRKGVVGSVYYIEGDFWPHDTTLWVKDFRGNHPRFLYYFFRNMAPTLSLLDVGSANPTLNRNHVHPVEVLWPPLPEQRAIASILGALDDKIELNRRMNATLEAMARALFQSWFVDFDPVRARAEGRETGLPAEIEALFPDRLVESELGEIPEGWRIGTLQDIAVVTMGLSPTGDSYNTVGQGIPLINGPVEFGEFFPMKTKWTTAPTRFCAPDDLIFCVRGSTTGRRVIADDIYCLGRGVCSIRAAQGMETYLYQSINHGLNRLLAKTTGSVFPSLSAPDIKNFQVLVAPNTVIRQYGEMTINLHERLSANVRTSGYLASLRDILLPKLISGELRVPDAQSLIEEVPQR